MKFKTLLAPIALAAFVAVSGGAQAAVTVYTSQAAYLAAITHAGVDSFDDLDYTTTLGTPQARTAGSHSYTASVGPTSVFFPASDDGQDVWLATNNRTDTVTFNGFSADVQAVGGFFFGTNIAGYSTAATALSIQVTDASGSITQQLLNPNTGSFLGFVSTGGLSSLKLWVGNQGTGEAGVWPTINDLTLGSVAAVPEPQTYALMLGGLGLLGWMARRRKA
ncbi:PEP-CTERM sorting domain-containing protein [Paucibacter sp. KBW04]|uniref:PEP-CTERM sorting domain-containing protein n=1 Tax=Paucibacter sp. KBW04 TaxID=2153361 RepID=UPI0018CC5BB8|nr:PEP-CTERM sorting domain-containing protein [Paucibacter sp. KBW04]